MDKVEYLRSKGWSTWYSEDYWVHEKTIVDKTRQDYTNYGMSTEAAYQYEISEQGPWKGQYMCLRF